MTPPNRTETRIALAAAVAIAGLAVLPVLDQGYLLALAVNILLYATLATAWALFSGPTHLVSLATAAFYGLGTYAVGLGIDHLPFALLIPVGGIVAALLAGLVGAATLRLSGVYFVIVTLGLAELVRQVVSWAQSRFTGSMGLYVFTDLTEAHIYWMLLALCSLVFLTAWLIGRSTLGFALRLIGDDEVAARHCGIDTARAKIVLFMISGAFIGMTGAIMAPRYAYIEPASAFNPMIAFLTLIMALLGGTRRIWGPLVGVIPFTILVDVLTGGFAQYTNIVLGLAFLAIVYLLPQGVTGRLEQAFARRAWRRRQAGEARAIEKGAA